MTRQPQSNIRGSQNRYLARPPNKHKAIIPYNPPNNGIAEQNLLVFLIIISENKLMQMKNTETMAYATPKTGSEANGARNSMAIPAIANITRKNANISIVELEFVVALHISFVRRDT
jgi:hypothetical protein